MGSMELHTVIFDVKHSSIIYFQYNTVIFYKIFTIRTISLLAWVEYGVEFRVSYWIYFWWLYNMFLERILLNQYKIAQQKCYPFLSIHVQ